MSNNVQGNQNVTSVPWSDILTGVKKISKWIQEQVGNDVTIYGIPRGGMIPAITLVHELEARGCKARFVAAFDHLEDSDKHKLVIIDEICDSGDTFRIIKQLFPKAKTATVYHRVGASFMTDFHAFTVNDDDWLNFPWEKS
jgi:xanthine phosphoribosyltransferase